MPNTTAFQYVFDKAETIAIDRKAMVGQSITRSGIVRSVSRGSMPWRFIVKLPDGIPWTDARTYIKAIDEADRFTVGNVALSDPGYANWLGNTSEFQGKTWQVICTKLPQWTIFARNQVAWDGEFEFVEYVA